MKDFYDVVVIGAGIGGLAAGALLAGKGFSVAVFEARPRPGGYCASFRRGGYAFDAALDAVSGCGEGGWLRRVLEKIGVEGEVEFVRLDPLRVDFFGEERITIPGEMSALRELLFGLAPREKDGTAGLLKAMEGIYRTAMSTPPETLYAGDRPGGRVGPLSRYRRLSYKDLLDDFVSDARLRAVLSDRSAFMGLPPSRVSALAMTIMFMTYAVGGGYRIKGGAERLTGALASGLRKAGGELHLKSPVTGILSADGKVSGMSLAGRNIPARAVISAIDAGRAAALLGKETGPVSAPSVSFFLVYLGLRNSPPMPDSMGYYPGYDIEGTFADIGEDITSPRASMEVVNYSNVSPGMARDGGASVMLMTKAAYSYREDWKACKGREMDRLIALAERTVLPGLKDRLVHAEAATPLTLERYTGNAKGAAFGWEQGVGNLRSSVDMGAPGLFLAGHWTYPGGGVESVAASGIIAAEKAAAVL